MTDLTERLNAAIIHCDADKDATPKPTPNDYSCLRGRRKPETAPETGNGPRIRCRNQAPKTLSTTATTRQIAAMTAATVKARLRRCMGPDTQKAPRREPRGYGVT